MEILSHYVFGVTISIFLLGMVGIFMMDVLKTMGYVNPRIMIFAAWMSIMMYSSIIILVISVFLFAINLLITTFL